MSKKLTKLSTRGRSDKSKKTKIQSNLNNSDEDFVSVVDKPKRNEDTAYTKNISTDSTRTAQDDYRSASVPFSCPFCGKSFASGQTLARASHLKACGNQLGVDTNQLLQIKKLEDKQAQEWKDLNLPIVTNNTTIKNKSIANKSNKSKAVKTELLASNDPQLEIALALSASLAQTSTVAEDTSSNAVQETKCWLPQPPVGAKVKPFKTKAKTALQVRPDDQRKQQMLEIVSSILERKQNSSSTYESYNFEVINSEESKCVLWCLAAFNPILPSNRYYIDLFRPYIIKDETAAVRKRKPSKEIDEEQQVDEENVGNPGLLKLSKAWNKLFQNGEKSDVTIYARDEEEIKAHSLVLHVRCPKMLRSSMLENDAKIISCPEVSAYILRSFLKLLYTGRLYVTLRNESDIQDAKYLASTFPQVDQWRVFVENINNPSFAGFMELSEDDAEAEIASQNLSGLLDILEEEEIIENDSEVDEEWSEMCEVLQSQKSLTQSPLASKDGSESPDIFGSDSEDDDDSAAATTANDNDNEPQSERKRKSILDERDQSDCKKSRLDHDSSYDVEDDHLTDQIDPNASQYSRRNVSTPSILQDLEASEMKTPSSCTTPLMQSSAMPDYESMLSPALQQELQRFGLKVIPRRTAVPLLKHIFEETHPQTSNTRRKVNFEAAEEEPEEESEEVLTQNSSISEPPEEDLPEESINLEQIAVKPEDDLNMQLLDFIQNNPELHRQALLFEPLWLEDLHQDFKAVVGGNARLNHVQDILDSQCITFRTRARHDKNNVRRNKS